MRQKRADKDAYFRTAERPELRADLFYRLHSYRPRARIHFGVAGKEPLSKLLTIVDEIQWAVG